MSKSMRVVQLSTGHLDGYSKRMLQQAATDTLTSCRDALMPSTLHHDIHVAEPLSAAKSLLVYPNAFGWICYAHDDIGILRDAKVTGVLVRAFEFARSVGYDWIWFDADADTIDELPVFEPELGGSRIDTDQIIEGKYTLQIEGEIIAAFDSKAELDADPDVEQARSACHQIAVYGPNGAVI